MSGQSDAPVTNERNANELMSQTRTMAVAAEARPTLKLGERAEAEAKITRRRNRGKTEAAASAGFWLGGSLPSYRLKRNIFFEI